MNIEYFEPYIPENLRDQDWKALYDKRFYLNGIEIILPDDMYDAKEIDNKLLVLISPRSIVEDFNYNRNIWCFNEKGEKVWEIMDMFDAILVQNPDIGKRNVDPYVGMGFDLEGAFGCRTFGGFYAKLDIQTGNVTYRGWSR